MKRLFISLLRVGDLIMQKPLIEAAGLGGEIHVLVNDEFEQLQELYPQWTFHFFPRKYLQNLINCSETSVLAPFEYLRRYMRELNRYSFDETINLTHNKISAYLMDQIKCEHKLGLEFSETKFKPFTNPWQNFFNATFSENKRSDLHYVAALAKSLDINLPKVSRIEDRTHCDTIYLQVLTSDSKKNWSLRNWQTMSLRLQSLLPTKKIKILASAFEVSKLAAYFSSEQIVVANLKEVRERLKSAYLLISGDTSVSHLAAEVRTPTVVLSLGSSDYSKTMPWIHGAWILSSEVECAPCPHSRPCIQSTHLCSEKLKVSTVLDLIVGIEKDRFLYSLNYPEVLVRTEVDMRRGLKISDYSTMERKNVTGSDNTNVF